ncbi:MAG: amidase family protein [Micropepsaceae bacterium]
MSFKEYADYDGIGLAGLIAKKKISAAEALEAAIARAEAHNPRLNAIILPLFDQARARAKTRLKGPFAGVPFLMKDIMGAMVGVPTRQGSAYMPAFPDMRDSTLTTRFHKAGFNTFGKTNVPEYGLLPITESTLYGPARNPWNTDHTPGGSSGGAGAAVAAGIVPIAHANDGGGSIRIPASSCGLVGLKPTRGRNPLGPDLGDVMSGLIAEGVVTRSVRDTAAVLDATHGGEPGDPYPAPPVAYAYTDEIKRKPRKLRIGYTTKNLAGQKVHADCIAAVRSVAQLCEDLGHTVEESSPQLDIAVLSECFMAVWASGLSQILDTIAMLTNTKPSTKTVQGLTMALYEVGKKITAAQYLNAITMLQAAGRTAAAWHNTYDVWLTPTLGAPPLPIGTVDTSERDPQKAFAPIIDYVPFTAIQNATGQPAINLPLHWNKAGLPIGVQFVGRFGDEATLLRIAAQLEKARPWKDKRPPIFG